MANQYDNRRRTPANRAMWWGPIAVIALLIIGGLIYASSRNDPNTASQPTAGSTSTTGAGSGTTSPAPGSTGGVGTR